MKVTCPECESAVAFEHAFAGAYCWAANAIVYKCPACKAPAYFAPSENEVEVGFLGASLVVDPIPGKRYPIKVGTERNGQMLLVSYNGNTREIPSSHQYVSSLKAIK